MIDRRTCIFFLTAAGMACFSLVNAGINTGGENGVVRTLSAKPLGATRLNIGAGISIFQSGSFIADVYDPVDGQEITSSSHRREQSRLLSSNIFTGVGLTRFWDMSATLPFYYDWLGVTSVHDGGIGDVELATKLTYPSLGKHLFYQGYFFGATVPVGMKKNGLFPRNPDCIESNDTNPARTFYSSDYCRMKGLLLWTLDVGAVAPAAPLQFHLNIGGMISSSLNHLRNTAIGSFAIEYSPTEIVSMFAEIHSESRWSTLSKLKVTYDPLLLSPGIRLMTASGLYLNFIGDISLSSRARDARLQWHPTSGHAENYRYSTGVIPDFGIQFALGWNGFMATPDSDKDGILDGEDKCVREKEDIDGFQDGDGCPDRDNDNDGIPDGDDKCPNDPEDKDGYEDDDGCADPDNDGDGIPDARDQCPGKAEDFDGSEDNDGCPDIDNDKDKVPDSLDKCPNDPEDFDGFQEDDGCPDLDNDQDGVPDLKDKCPDAAGLPSNEGCPRVDTVKPKKDVDFPKSQILYGVEFRKVSADLTFQSYQFIEPLLQKLRTLPEVAIEVHGHTDAIGGMAKNMQLSQMRAEAIRQYLIAKGISPERIRAIGFGSSSPVADNKTASGRAQNRRIEVLRVK